MSEEDEKEDIVVRGPTKSIVRPERKADMVAKRELEEERYHVIQYSHKLGVYFSLSILLTGVLLLGLLIYAASSGRQEWLIMSSDAPHVGLAFWITISAINIVGGLLLAGSE